MPTHIALLLQRVIQLFAATSAAIAMQAAGAAELNVPAKLANDPIILHLKERIAQHPGKLPPMAYPIDAAIGDREGSEVEDKGGTVHITGGGPVDSPPTFHDGFVLFGCRNGWCYCLRASDGRLA